MFYARLFICALWSPAGKGLTSWLSFVVFSVSLSLSHWYPGSGVVLDCIDSWSLQPYYLDPIWQFFGSTHILPYMGNFIPHYPMSLHEIFDLHLNRTCDCGIFRSCPKLGVSIELDKMNGKKTIILFVFYNSYIENNKCKLPYFHNKAYLFPLNIQTFFLPIISLCDKVCKQLELHIDKPW